MRGVGPNFLMKQYPATTLLVLGVALTSVILAASAMGTQQEIPRLPPQVYQELRDSFYIDAAMELLGNPRSRIEMHEYLTEETGEFFFLITQSAGDSIIDEFRPTQSESIQSLMLTIDTGPESLRMVHIMLSPDASPQAELFTERALQSVEEGGPRDSKLYLLGVVEVTGGQYQVLMRQETSSTGFLLYWIHFF